MSIRVNARLPWIAWIVEVSVVDLIEDESHYEAAVKDYENLQQVLFSLAECISWSLITPEVAHQMDNQHCKDGRYDNEVVLDVPVVRPPKDYLFFHIIVIAHLLVPEDQQWADSVSYEADTKRGNYTSRDCDCALKSLSSFHSTTELYWTQLLVLFCILVKTLHDSNREFDDDKHLLVSNAYLEYHWVQEADYAIVDFHMHCIEVVNDA